jgi:hypothetical protein
MAVWLRSNKLHHQYNQQDAPSICSCSTCPTKSMPLFNMLLLNMSNKIHAAVLGKHLHTIFTSVRLTSRYFSGQQDGHVQP